MNFENPLKKTIKAGTLGLGLLAGLGANEAVAQSLSVEQESKDPITNNIEKEKSEATPASYDLSKICQLDLEDLDGKKSQEKATAEKVMTQALIYDDIKERELAYSDKTSASYRLDPEGYKKNLEQVQEDKKKLQEKDWKYLKSHIELSKVDKIYIAEAPTLIALAEEAREKVKSVISSPEYLAKLEDEFKCSPEIAKQHQLTRLSNVDKINYKFTHNRLLTRGKMNSKGAYIPNTNIILLSYNLKFNAETDFNKITKEDLLATAIHEFWHAATNGNSGLSSTTKEKLTASYYQANHNLKDSVYQNNPTERYVRFKSLEADLVKFGIKKVGESLTKEGYERMVDLYNSNQLNLGTSQFLEHIQGFGTEAGYEALLDIFNSIASLDKSGKPDKDLKPYLNPAWEYGEPSTPA